MEPEEVCQSLHVCCIWDAHRRCIIFLPQNAEGSQGPEELARRESELKEQALRNKVVRTRKRTSSDPPAESSGVKGSN